ncbi:hypothetical protein MRX96_042662 [Rhipicephalus microplus]
MLRSSRRVGVMGIGSCCLSLASDLSAAPVVASRSVLRIKATAAPPFSISRQSSPTYRASATRLDKTQAPSVPGTPSHAYTQCMKRARTGTNKAGKCARR